MRKYKGAENLQVIGSLKYVLFNRFNHTKNGILVGQNCSTNIPLFVFNKPLPTVERGNTDFMIAAYCFERAISEFVNDGAMLLRNF